VSYGPQINDECPDLTDAITQGIRLLYKEFKEIGKGVAVTG